MELESRLNKIEAISQESPQTASKKSKKKRKREKEKERCDDGQNDLLPVIDRPNEQSPLNVKIEVIYDQTDKTPPIVGYFPSGYKPSKHNESNNLHDTSNEENATSSLSQPSVKFYRNAQRTKIEKSSNERNEKWRSSERMELVVSPNGSNVDFVGKSYKGEATAAQLCTYALGVLDKKTKTLKIMPIAGNKIFRLEPKIQGVDASDKEPSVLENEDLSKENMAVRKKTLTDTYGTKKSITQGKRMEIMMQGDNPESRKDLDQKIDNVVVNKAALEDTSAHVARNIPPHNTSATTPQEAYPLGRIILTGEWDYLEDLYEILQAGEGAAINAYPVFVRNRIHKLREIQDEVERKTYSRIFSYITHLLKFKDLHSMDGVSSAKNHKFPSILRQKFMGMFTPESRKLPVEKIDLLISYVLVLSLYADDFRTDPTDIAKDLRVSRVMVRTHFENLGCKIVCENKLSLATLPVPLKFPVQRQRRARR
ncbi:DNA-directed RNA polymerase I subunit rpa49 [Ricinus communis]|uniref:DNA-directed RNA polymerase I 49 kDa polypeptide, putative n=1 Tax=Ricinus communis TaxID=3988 RepID=B9S5U8_RICCO|nr:DNA-directed RNA polymerase I subunit rpa49 [Ricinus communis]XP_015576117.1 DNA-directed RNA polymerase I subunit rpa49 [Ricinus communis]EEF41035.1 DNA-directed RNA polymerase I 49 kDa polypeptide, putative [Ricinus communis]|eukprot:XP_002521367.1 DNA-directed RNA polymerase I subunit rpa49 [Ricinus communis]